jgi:hypothetical protein
MSTNKKNISGVSDDVSASIKNDLSSKDNEIKGFLEEKKIGISISETEDLGALGFSVEHLEDAMVEFARHLLIQGAQLVYGGDLRKGGFTRILSELSYQYRDKTQYKKQYVFNYSSYPIYLNLTNADELELKKNRVKLVKVKPASSVKVISNDFFIPDTFENKSYWADSLTLMRTEMNKFTDARIMLGGRTKGYSGAMPGLLEESLIALRNKKPIYLIGTYGGITQQVINAILGKESQRITTEYQKEDEDYAVFFERYNKVNYEVTIKELKKFGVKSLADNNGLTTEENIILFNTKNVPEMVFYVMKGLKSLNK